jgi:ABC-type amino acid transport system permease subunit
MSFFRGIPLICHIAGFIYFIPILPTVLVCLLVFSLNTSAYLLSVFKVFIEHFPQEELETAIGLGFSKSHIIKKIIFPQMLRYSIPLFFVELISLAKNVSILGGFGILEIFRRGDIIGSNDYNYGRALIIVAVIYYLITFFFGFLEQTSWVQNLRMNNGNI